MAKAVRATPGPFGDLHYRWIGPAVMGGRLDVVAGVPGQPNIIYVGHSSAGLWKSTDGGLRFASIFSGRTSQAIGAIAIDPRDPRVVYAGTGEAFPRNTAAAGDGLYRSPDAGKSWHFVGFGHSGSIAKIAIDPADDRVVLVAVVGHEFAPSAERGIYRSTDGGRHFARTLFVNSTTAGSDLSFNPKTPAVVYAGTFDFLRRPWTMRSGGPGSGLWKSADFGKTWMRLTDPTLRNGLPSGPIDRVGVSVCPSNPNVVYALVPNRAGLLYRSRDAGKHWELRNASQEIDFRPFYFSQVRCDPHEAKTVYAVAGALSVSRDGGKRFRYAGGGGDNHDLWIDPSDPQRLLNASDMGLHLSQNGGRTWSYDNVVPFAQIYRVGYDFAQPYHVMGGMQDHEVWWGPSDKRSLQDGVGEGDWRNISDWGDGQFAMADPHDDNLVYENTHFGDLALLNVRTGTRRYISPQPIVTFGTAPSAFPFRFNWSAPLLVSLAQPGTVYFAGNVLFRTRDRGTTWQQVSPDLTHCDASKLGRSGGPVSHDNTNAETYCTIYAIAEDARDPKTLYAGTDDGHLDVTRDGGTTWSDVIANVPGLPGGSRVAAVAASPVTQGLAYAAFDRHQLDDARPYAYVTRDYGRTWQSVSNGLDGYVHVLRGDPRNPSVVYAGTERGAFVSLDGGLRWQDLRLGLPSIPVFDLQIHPRDNDLILATHGRGFYILDDVTALQGLRAARSEPLRLFVPQPAVRYVNALYTEHGRGGFVAENKAYGALLTFYLANAPRARLKDKSEAAVRVTDERGVVVASFTVPAHAGINRASWDLRQTIDPKPLVQDPRAAYVFYPLTIAGPRVLPGTYLVTLSAAGAESKAPLEVLADPAGTPDAAGLAAGNAFVIRNDAAQERAERAASAARSLQAQIAARRRQAAGSAAADLDAVDRFATNLLASLRNPEPSGYRNGARTIEELAYLRYTTEQYDGPPTQAQLAQEATYEAETQAAVMRLNAFLESLPATNARLRAKGVRPLATPIAANGLK